MDNVEIYYWDELAWTIEYDFNEHYALALCPRKKCHCRLSKSKDKYNIGEYKYECINCDFKITLDKSIEEKARDFIDVYDTREYRDAEMINLDGELVKLNSERVNEDSDYWIEAKLSKNKKNEKQLMILVGSRKKEDKTQLFLNIDDEKLSFDQNNSHPKEIFTKVVATFKDSQDSIEIKDSLIPKDN